MNILSKIKNIKTKTCRGLNRLFIFTGYTISVVLIIFLVRHHLPSHPARVLVLDTLAATTSFLENHPTLGTWKTALYRALEDRHLHRIVLRLDSNASFSIADAQALRSLLLKLKQQGKEIICYADGLGTLGSTGLAGYMIGSCANKLYVSCTGGLFFEGISTERLYFGQFLKDWGVRGNMIACGKYKSGSDALTRSNMSLEEREMLVRLFAQWEKQILHALAQDGRVPMSQLKHGIHNLTCSSEEGQKLKWIDRVASCWNQIADQYVSEPDSVTANTYSHKRKGIVRWIKDTLSHRHHIALMRIEGELGSTQLDHESYCKELIKLSKNDAVKAVIILVNTPGGTPSASETLRYGIECCQKAGKFTMIVMESVAASGGFWLSCAADKIWAQPGTLTGSIGVYGGKVDIEDALKRWNIGQASVSLNGTSGSSASLNRHWSTQQKERWETMLSSSYQYFRELVAKSRKLSIAQVEALAQGQVWTGEEAKALGLVDDLGDFWDARAWAKNTIPGLKSLETIDYTPENRYSLKWLISTLQNHIHFMLQWACTSNTKIYARFHPYTR